MRRLVMTDKAMSNDAKLAQKIRQLKPASGFRVRTKREQVAVCKIGRILRESGAIDFHVVTREIGEDEFKVAAI